MPVFEYQQRDRNGKLYKGRLEANNLREASSRLRDEGMYLISLKPLVESSSSKLNTNISFGGKRVKLRDLLVFTKQFAVMIRAGLNLNACLNLLSQQTENEYFAGIILQIRRDVEGGESLHSAVAKHPKIFPSIYIYMIEAGEASGQLETVLERLAEHLERSFELNKKVKGALTYPVIVACFAVMAVFILMTVVVPQFISMFEGMSIELPLITKLLIVVSGFCTNYWYLIIGFVVAVVFGSRYYYRTPDGRKMIDKFIYNMALIGPVIQKLSSANFSRTFGTLLESGVAITTSLEIVERAVGNSVVEGAIGTARVNITRGNGIATQLAETKIFPPLVTQLISVGEETGELPVMLNEIADFYEKEASYAVEGLTDLIQPIIMLVVGGVVGLIIAAIYLPMFKISDILK